MEKSGIEWGDPRGVENLKKSDIVLHEQADKSGDFLTPEEEQEISQNLSDLLVRRIERSTQGCEERADQLRYAIRKFPGELNSLLTSFSSYLDEVGVSSVEVYVLGGFAREAAGEINPDDLDTTIRPDTDIDVAIRCISKSGVKINPQVIPSPFTQVEAKWRESDISNTFDFVFYVADTPRDLKPDKPRIRLFQRALHDA